MAVYFKFDDLVDEDFEYLFETQDEIQCAYCQRKVTESYGGMFIVGVTDDDHSEEPWVYMLFCTPLCRALSVIGGIAQKDFNGMVDDIRKIYENNANNQEE